MDLEQFVEHLVCPSSQTPVRVVNLADSGPANLSLRPVRRAGTTSTPIGATSRVLMTDTGETAYPVVGEFPVLLGPELLVPAGGIDDHETIDLTDPRYREAYEEMRVYNARCNESIEASRQPGNTELLEPMGALTPAADISGARFPFPEELWLDARHDALSQLDAYSYLSPVDGRTVLQLGGSGSHAIKMLRAGASKAFLLTPMIGEARVAMQLAREYGVADRLGCVIGIGEEVPFRGGTFDLIYSGGCLHHMRLGHAAAELHRVLRDLGKFSGVDPWKTPLHTIGTAVLGKREKSVYCQPITPVRMAPIAEQFDTMLVTNHGPLLRYLFLALEKVGVQLSIRTMLRIGRLDDRLGRVLRLGRFGGSLVMAATKTPVGGKQTGVRSGSST